MEANENYQIAKPGQYLTFVLQGQAYGVSISTVREINRLAGISTVPQVPDYVSGVVNLRGKVVPVVDLGRRFGFAEAPRTKETCIIVIEGATGHVGTIVESVSGVVDLTAEQIEPAPSIGGGVKQSFVVGMGKADDCVIVLVDPVNVLSHLDSDVKAILAARAA